MGEEAPKSRLGSEWRKNSIDWEKTCLGDQGEIGLREKFNHLLKARGDKRGETRFFCQREISLCAWESLKVDRGGPLIRSGL